MQTPSTTLTTENHPSKLNHSQHFDSNPRNESLKTQGSLGKRQRTDRQSDEDQDSRDVDKRLFSGEGTLSAIRQESVIKQMMDELRHIKSAPNSFDGDKNPDSYS